MTGTFDNWKKSNKLIKGEDGTLQKEIELPLHEKVTYKVKTPSAPLASGAIRLAPTCPLPLAVMQVIVSQTRPLFSLFRPYSSSSSPLYVRN